MPDAAPTLDARTRRALARLRAAPLNVDPEALGGPGWHYDERLQLLPSEVPGAPVPGGSWDVARRLMRGYAFADPSIVRAAYDANAPLHGRTMLLEVRFHRLRLHVGCRVTGVYERAERTGDGEACVWGWSYATLQGHFEQGEMHWQVLKWPASGAVAFRIRSWSRGAPDSSLPIRIGLRVVGRREQRRFYDSTCRRMRLLTEAALHAERPAAAVRDVAARVTARPTSAGDRAHDELARNVGAAPLERT